MSNIFIIFTVARIFGIVLHDLSPYIIEDNCMHVHPVRNHITCELNKRMAMET